MKTKSITKRILAVLLSLLMCVGATIPVLAEGFPVREDQFGDPNAFFRAQLKNNYGEAQSTVANSFDVYFTAKYSYDVTAPQDQIAVYLTSMQRAGKNGVSLQLKFRNGKDYPIIIYNLVDLVIYEKNQPSKAYVKANGAEFTDGEFTLEPNQQKSVKVYIPDYYFDHDANFASSNPVLSTAINYYYI